MLRRLPRPPSVVIRGDTSDVPSRRGEYVLGVLGQTHQVRGSLRNISNWEGRGTSPTLPLPGGHQPTSLGGRLRFPLCGKLVGRCIQRRYV
jgi:hypothetical protein